MSTLRQIEANRRNAQKSTGPTSVTGKAASSMNALKTGIHAKSLVLPSEKLADLEQLIDEYYHHHNPASPEARALVDDLIHCEWLLRRLRAAETQMWAYDHEETTDPTAKYPLGQTAAATRNAFAQLQWRIDAPAAPATAPSRTSTNSRPKPPPPRPARRTRSAESPDPPSLPPSPQTTSPQIGFVPSTPIPAPPQPAPAALNPARSPHRRTTRLHVLHPRPGTNKNDGKWFRKRKSRGTK